MKIILAVDGSRYSDWAADLLLKLPLSAAPEVTVAHAVDQAAARRFLIDPQLAPQYLPILEKGLERSLAVADRLTAQVAKRLRARWKKATPVVEDGPAAERIIALAGKRKADLIVLGSRGLSDIQAFLMGSVSEKVVTYAPCSVLVVKKRPRAVKRILLAMDGSPASETESGFLKSHFRREGIRVTVLNVWEYPLVPPNLPVPTIEEQYGKAMAGAGFGTRALTVIGHPAAKIVETADRMKADLVVVGSRGRTGLRRFILGSVSHQVVKHCRSSVLVVRGR